MATPLGCDLILDEDRGDAHRLVRPHYVGHVLDVTVTIVAVHHDGEARRREDLAHGLGHLPELGEVDVGKAGSCADDAESPDLESGESGLFDQLGREAVMRRRQQDQLSFRQELFP